MLFVLMGLTAACGSTSPSAQDPEQSVDAPGSGGDGEYAFGTDRGQITIAIDKAFAGQNGKARWEGDVLVLAVDGDATSTVAGFTQCRVLDQILLEGDDSVIEYPNGRVSCAEILPAD